MQGRADYAQEEEDLTGKGADESARGVKFVQKPEGDCVCCGGRPKDNLLRICRMHVISHYARRWIEGGTDTLCGKE